MNKLLSFLVIIFLSQSQFSLAQDLLDQLRGQSEVEKKPVIGTFKGTRIINGQSVETRGKGNLEMIISHRFGRINSGVYNLFGLDDSNVRLGLEYSLSDRFTLGIGRNSFNKIYDGYLKGKIIQQKSEGTPVTITWVSDASIYSLKRPELEMTFERRLRFVHQVLIARKINSNISLQLMPSYVHRNLVATANESNDLFALGLAGKVSLSRRVGLTGEYYYRFGDNLPGYNSLGLGIEIETGGHVFQLQFTNSNEMTPSGFIPSTTGDFFDGDIHFGFNVSRSFQVGKRN
jgi:hypothetical protein